MASKPRVTFEGCEYAVRSASTQIPDLKSMSRIEALMWLNRHTYHKGTNHRRPTPNLRGLTVTIR